MLVLGAICPKESDLLGRFRKNWNGLKNMPQPNPQNMSNGKGGRETSYGRGTFLRECEVSGDRLGRDEGVDECWKGPDGTDQLRGQSSSYWEKAAEVWGRGKAIPEKPGDPEHS